MRSEVSGDFQDTFSPKINEIVEQFASSSESLQTLCLEMKTKIEELQTTMNMNNSHYSDQLKEFKDQLTKATSVSSHSIPIIQQEELKQNEIESA